MQLKTSSFGGLRVHENKNTLEDREFLWVVTLQ
jgi:hypothetical protein